MAGGVRLHHPTLRNATYVIEHHRPYKHPLLCSVCQKVHERKTYHIRFDNEGDAIVSPEIVDRLKQVPGMAGLKILNPVKRPPAQTISLNGVGTYSIVEALPIEVAPKEN